VGAVEGRVLGDVLRPAEQAEYARPGVLRDNGVALGVGLHAADVDRDGLGLYVAALGLVDDVVPPDRFLRHIDADDTDDDARGDLRARDKLVREHHLRR